MKKNLGQFPHFGMRLAYFGKSFSGFQVQDHSPSVQEKVEKAFATLFKKKSFRITFTSRTDAGVHAYDQWILIKQGMAYWNALPEQRRLRFLISFNALVRPDIMAWQILRLSENFHPKTSVEWKEYHYHILLGTASDPLHQDRQFHFRGPLHIRAMQRALKSIVGRHDFSAFAMQSLKKDGNKKKCKNKLSGVRTMLKADLVSRSHPIFEGQRLLTIRFRATGFLRYMCRNLVGTLIEMGRGRPFNLKLILLSKDRRQAGPIAPPHALILTQTRVKRGHFEILQASRSP